MTYATPELVMLGSASSLVQGPEKGDCDNVCSGETRPAFGIVLGLDD